jgi:serralysin
MPATRAASLSGSPGRRRSTGSVPHVAILADGGFDTLVGVYTGAAVDSLTEVASNDDDGVGGSSVSFLTTGGTTYRIAVDGFAGKAGLFSLAARPSPVNDNFAEAIPLSGAAGMIQLTSFGTSPSTRITLSWGPLILGSNDAETLTGTSSADEIRGLGGNDIILGGGGADVVFGGPGADLLRGGSDGDFLLDHTGLDVLRGESRNDRLNARDRAARDRGSGGDGTDRCYADRTDIKRNCP